MANRKVDNSSRQPTTQTKVTIDKKNGKINQQWTQLKSMGDETKRRKNGRRSEGGSWSCWRNESGFGRRKNYGGRNWTESKIQIRTCKKKEVFNSCVAVASDEGKERTRNGRVVKKKEKKLGDREVSFQQLVDIEGEEFELFHKKPSENREEASLSFAVFCLFLLLNRVLIFFPVLVSKKMLILSSFSSFAIFLCFSLLGFYFASTRYS